MVSCCTYHITYGKQKQANKQDIGYPICLYPNPNRIQRQNKTAAIHLDC